MRTTDRSSPSVSQSLGTITASMLYNHVLCEHRVTMDCFAPPERRDAASPFVRLLWERGTRYEREVIAALKVSFVDLSALTTDDKQAATLEAMRKQAPLIYNGRLVHGDLLGEPDLLRWTGEGYLPGDIKSGAGEEGTDDARRPKEHYALQLAHYVQLLESLGHAARRAGFIWDVHGQEVDYDLTAPVNRTHSTTWWETYQTALQAIRSLRGLDDTRPAYAAVCKQCHWYTACRERVRADDDLTLVPELGRSRRDILAPQFPTVKALATADIESFHDGKKTVFPGIGIGTLRDFQARAILLTDPQGTPYLRQPVNFPAVPRELFFDLEADPLRDLCYLHGFYVREAAGERYVAYFSPSADPAGERAAFDGAIRFIRQNLPAALYYYSAYEKTMYRKLAQRYPEVAGTEEIEALFAQPTTIDLYHDVIRKGSFWPTNDHSIKTLARYLGFQWRDSHPSGAASIEWYDQYVTTDSQEIKQRILDYNEDDCKATLVLLDGIKKLSVNGIR